MKREYYSDDIANFLNSTPESIYGKLAISSEFPIEQGQRNAWLAQINILQSILSTYQGRILFEYSIPRMGRRIDVVLLIGPAIFVIEYKVGEDTFHAYAKDQVWDYALDLKNFHEPSHAHFIAPILVATEAQNADSIISTTPHNDNLFSPVMTNVELLGDIIKQILSFVDGNNIDSMLWESGRYCPTPTIIEAAMALYNGHSVTDISRSDASAINLSQTSDAISEIIRYSKAHSCKSICFVTGVPGAGKTLVGLNIATKYIDKANELYSVFLSGNGPLVAILREALTRDKVRHEKERGRKAKKSQTMSEVKMFIQNVHNFRDDCLRNNNSPPIEHVVLFDEAQRAWTAPQTINFMRRKKRITDFNMSEPEFLISCLNRHSGWAVIVCLVGGGQEINTGEAGISE